MKTNYIRLNETMIMNYVLCFWCYGMSKVNTHVSIPRNVYTTITYDY
jgi:hypothetical protein